MRVMGRMWLCAAILLSVAVGPAAAQWQTDEKATPDEPWRKHQGDFGAMLVFTSEPDQFLEAWSRPPTDDYRPEMVLTGSTRRGETVAAFVLFAGCRPDSKGKCSSSVDFVLRKPDGSVYAEHVGAELWIDKPAPPPRRLQLGVANLMLRVETDDPLGVYRLKAEVRDHLANVELRLEQTLTVEDSE